MTDSGHKGLSPLLPIATRARFLIHRQDNEDLQYLLESKFDVNTLDDSGNAPIHIAANTGNIPALQILLSHGASVNIRNGDGSTPLHVAVCSIDASIMLNYTRRD